MSPIDPTLEKGFIPENPTNPNSSTEEKVNEIVAKQMGQELAHSSPKIIHPSSSALSSSNTSTTPTDFIQKQLETVQQEKESIEIQVTGKLEEAIQSKSSEQFEHVLKEALQSNINLKTLRIKNFTLGTFIVMYGCPEMLAHLNPAVTDLNAPDANGWTPATLTIALLENNPHFLDALPKMLQALHTAGADLNAPDANGWTPATKVIDICDNNPNLLDALPNVFQALHAAGEDLNASNSARRTPATTAIMLCADNPNFLTALPNVLQALHAAGADLNAFDTSGLNPATTAIELCSNNPNFLKALPKIFQALHAAGANLQASVVHSANSALAQVAPNELTAFVNEKSVTQTPTQAENAVVRAIEAHAGPLSTTDKANALQLMREAWSLGVVVSAECIKLVRDREKFLSRLVQENSFALVPLPQLPPTSLHFGEEYNKKARHLLVQYVQNLGLKLPKPPPPFSAESIIDRDAFLKLIAMRNGYGDIPPANIFLSSPDIASSQSIAKLYENIARPLRSAWLQNFPTLDKIQRITKRGILQWIPISVQSKLGKGSSKTAYAITLYKETVTGTVQKTKAFALPKSGHPSPQVVQTEIHEECALSQRLSSQGVPNLIHMREVVILDPQGHIIGQTGALMDLCEGGNCVEFLNKNLSRLSAEERRRLAIELVDALVGLHAARYCHCDLKLDNVFVKNDERGIPHVVLADLGMTSRIGSTTEIRGTNITPEQWRAKVYGSTQNIITDQIDLWCLGDILSVLRGWSVYPVRSNHLWAATIAAQPPGEIQRLYQTAMYQAQQEAMRTNHPFDAVIAKLLSPSRPDSTGRGPFQVRPSAREVLDALMATPWV